MTSPLPIRLSALDLVAMACYVLACGLVTALIAKAARRRSTAAQHSVADRRMPFWLIGIADVATGDGADAFWIYIFFTAGFIGFHRFYWISALFGLPLAVFWARYWRRLALLSPGQFFEVRYSGPIARGFRVFSSVYGVIFGHAIVIGYVLRGFAQSLAPFVGWAVPELLLLFGGLTLAYTLLSGLWAVAYVDLVQFAFVMAGRIALVCVLFGVAGGLHHVLSAAINARGSEFLTPFPPSPAGHNALFGAFALDPWSLCALALVGLGTSASHQLPAVQKTLAAKDERHAVAGQLLNTLLSLVLRTIPLVLIGLCAVALLPPPAAGTSETTQWATLVSRYAPHGLFGLLLIGIIAGYSSTLAGLLNFSAASWLQDVYLRVLSPTATEKQQVRAARVATLLVSAIGNLWAWLLLVEIDAAWINFINSVVFLFVLPVGLLRWLWWRLNIYGELVAFFIGFPLAYVAWFGVAALHIPAYKDRPYWQAFGVLSGLGLAVVWVVTKLTPPEPMAKLAAFYTQARPPGFWGPVKQHLGLSTDTLVETQSQHLRELSTGLLTSACCACLILGLSALLVGQWPSGTALLLAAACCGWLTLRGAFRGLPTGGTPAK